MSIDPQAPVFDPTVLTRMLGDDPELIREIVDAYFEVIPQLTAQLAEARRQSSCEQVAFHAHSIKGAAANLGARQLQQLAAEMEVAARASDLARCEALGPGLIDALAALERELRTRFPKKPVS
jgi:HPt (histidine-containing phosphotransfer) domain-containing protein